MSEVRITKKKIEALKLQVERKWMEARTDCGVQPAYSCMVNQGYEDIYRSLLALVVGSSDFDELVKK